ncbi:MAG: hypothetical protein ABI612_06500 [Betaproteobacteria bacterium]
MTSKVSFRLKHPTLDLSAIAQSVGLPIARIWTAGERRITPKGDPLDGVHPGSYCAFRVESSEGTIPAAIKIVDTALHVAVHSHRNLQGQELEKSLYCTIMGEGEFLDLESLRQLINWGIELGIDA